MNANRTLGQRGEDAAAAYLTKIGWTIVERNWRCRQGELDIVAHDGRRHVVCEVKTRRGVTLGTPFEAITSDKAVRLRRLAWEWASHNGVPGARIRVDALCLLPARHPGDLVVDGFSIEHERDVI
ncbi:YraN family protein [Spirillospora sp. NPDC047279]|uniref:YraN family protein n=1 Tax=Spirillospora sp. NPDC047279 TaxID=3155478 RepID=UPI003407CEBE